MDEIWLHLELIHKFMFPATLGQRNSWAINGNLTTFADTIYGKLRNTLKSVIEVNARVLFIYSNIVRYMIVVHCTAQDRSPFCIFQIMNGISQHTELMDTILVGNHCHFRNIIE